MAAIVSTFHSFSTVLHVSGPRQWQGLVDYVGTYFVKLKFEVKTPATISSYP